MSVITFIRTAITPTTNNNRNNNSNNNNDKIIFITFTNFASNITITTIAKLRLPSLPLRLFAYYDYYIRLLPFCATITTY